MSMQESAMLTITSGNEVLMKVIAEGRGHLVIDSFREAIRERWKLEPDQVYALALEGGFGEASDLTVVTSTAIVHDGQVLRRKEDASAIAERSLEDHFAGFQDHECVPARRPPSTTKIFMLDVEVEQAA